MEFPSLLFYARPLFYMPTDEDAKFFDRIKSGHGSANDYALAEALALFRPEGYFTLADRDAALGSTNSPVCQYIEATHADIQNDLRSGNILACGYGVDHARFGDMLNILLPDVLTALIADYSAQPAASSADWPRIGEAEIVVARVMYSLRMEQPKDNAMVRLYFGVQPGLGTLPPKETIGRTGGALLSRARTLFAQQYAGLAGIAPEGHG